MRERAKNEMTNFLQMSWDKEVMLAKFQKFVQGVILFQRMYRIRALIKRGERISYKKGIDDAKLAKGI